MMQSASLLEYLRIFPSRIPRSRPERTASFSLVSLQPVSSRIDRALTKHSVRGVIALPLGFRKQDLDWDHRSGWTVQRRALQRRAAVGHRRRQFAGAARAA